VDSFRKPWREERRDEYWVCVMDCAVVNENGMNKFGFLWNTSDVYLAGEFCYGI